ncbi:MAG: hypothetical protein JNK14_13870 [Chitinophagaceae bacterium]|nr:hypothetical protein [Chitinophagaceae bacterium]
MKISRYLLGFFTCLAVSAQAQNESGIDSTGLPGDNFSLQGALAMFQKASSPEDFEKLLNSQDNNVNNLDLNEDGETDYIRVIDNSDKDVHAFVLQAVISEKESQDIAVIELEKTGDTTAVLQIVGDEDIYGEQVIVEPDGGGDDDGAFLSDLNNTVAHGPYAGQYTRETRVVINVWFWPSVRFVYGPLYRPWVSPWRWRHHPAWWRPWRPLAWRVWHPRCIVHHRPFVVVRTHRVVRAHAIYRPVRMSSVTVRTRHATAVNGYRVTRTKTTVTGPRGRQATKTTTTVRGKGGQVKGRKTTIKRR